MSQKALRLVEGDSLDKQKALEAALGQIEQVIINLAVNARDAMAEGGKLTIQTENAQFNKPVRRMGEIMPAGDYTRIKVSE